MVDGDRKEINEKSIEQHLDEERVHLKRLGLPEGEIRSILRAQKNYLETQEENKA